MISLSSIPSVESTLIALATQPNESKKMKIMMATSEDGRPRWLVCLAHETGIHAYAQQTNEFRYSHPLDVDHRWDMEFTYSGITPEATVERMNTGIGLVSTLDERTREKLRPSELRFSAHEVLGDASSVIATKAE